MEVYLPNLLGGALIGVAASLLLLFNGKILGVSGILNTTFPIKYSGIWKIYFLSGLILGGFLLQNFYPLAFDFSNLKDKSQIILGGFLVGSGTYLGSGCTSGHGVCGVSRLSVRSLIATITFIGFGILSRVIFKNI